VRTLLGCAAVSLSWDTGGARWLFARIEVLLLPRATPAPLPPASSKCGSETHRLSRVRCTRFCPGRPETTLPRVADGLARKSVQNPSVLSSVAVQ
jgi:hypothetical protein